MIPDLKGSFYIAQYPVRWIAESALHFLPPLTDTFLPTPTCNIDSTLILFRCCSNIKVVVFVNMPVFISELCVSARRCRTRWRCSARRRTCRTCRRWSRQCSAAAAQAALTRSLQPGRDHRRDAPNSWILHCFVARHRNASCTPGVYYGTSWSTILYSHISTTIQCSDHYQIFNKIRFFLFKKI